MVLWLIQLYDFWFLRFHKSKNDIENRGEGFRALVTLKDFIIVHHGWNSKFCKTAYLKIVYEKINSITVINVCNKEAFIREFRTREDLSRWGKTYLDKQLIKPLL